MRCYVVVIEDVNSEPGSALSGLEQAKGPLPELLILIEVLPKIALKLKNLPAGGAIRPSELTLGEFEPDLESGVERRHRQVGDSNSEANNDASLAVTQLGGACVRR